MALLGWLS